MTRWAGRVAFVGALVLSLLALSLARAEDPLPHLALAMGPLLVVGVGLAAGLAGAERRAG